MVSDAAELTARLTALIRARSGNPYARASGLEPLPGHAGVSYRFVCEQDERHGAEPAAPLVLRLAPAGAPATGPNDVARQARIMTALAGVGGVPVPRILWFDDDPRWLGQPFFIAEFVAGEKPALGERRFEAGEMRRCAAAAVAAAAALHRLDSRPCRAAFGEPVGLASELDRLARLLDRPTIDAQLIARAPALRERLAARIPGAMRIGCVHGDFQWSNCLFRDGRLVALIDWELAQVGAVWLDLGWLALFSDHESWATDDLVPACCPAPEELVAGYEEATAEKIPAGAMRWFRAFAAYRFGVITAFNLMLHRRGKRHDPMWETFALSGARLFERGLELLG